MLQRKGPDSLELRPRSLLALSDHQPHLLYPQFKQVAHPSITTSALVLHLWHMVALGGKLVPSPVTSTSSSRLAGAAITASLFFFERS